MEYSIRPYQRVDRSAVFEIAADTAFFGEAVEAFLEDRRLFCDVFCAYYTDYEPQNCWVAEAENGVVGYLLGCENSSTLQSVWLKSVLPAVVKNILAGRYQFGPRLWRYLVELSLASMRGEMPHADYRRFPAHLHINIVKTFRGSGIGRRLIETFLTKLQDKGVTGVHLKTTSENRAACALYEKMGFQLLKTKETQLWKHWLSHRIDYRCYGLSFD